jgi:DUF1009 family protein
MAAQDVLGLIAGNGIYPATMARAARKAGVPRLVAAAFVNETDPALQGDVDALEWMRVGQLGKMIKFFQREGVRNAVMVGQISPKNLFDLRPDLRTLVLLAKLKRRNAETIFGAIGDELAKEGITLLPATSYLDEFLPPAGHVCGPVLKEKALADAAFGLSIAKETSRLDIGQSVVVKKGTVLAVEAFEGTNECIKRGGALGRGSATLAKVAKPAQDMRFDVPVIGPATIESCADAGISLIAIEAGKTLILGLEQVQKICQARSISLYAFPATDPTR